MWHGELPADHEPEHDVKDTGEVGSPSFKAARDVDRQFQWVSICLLIRTLDWNCAAQGR